MQIEEFLTRISTLKIAVIGDFIIDRYIYGDVSRISPEAPVPVVHQEYTKTCAGGAGNVAMNLNNLGVRCHLFTRGDSIGTKSPIVSDHYVHPGNTPIKTRVMSGNHHLIRIDEEGPEQEPVQYDDLSWKEDFEKILPTLDAVVFSDYHKGTISHDMAKIIIDRCKDLNIPVIVDAKKDFDKYNHADTVKCNQKEFQLFHDRYKVMPHEFSEAFENKNFVITQGQRGISWYGRGTDAIFGVDGIEANIIDVCGAGDTVTAMLAIGQAIGLSIGRSCEIANIAAAEVCTHPGVYPIMKEDLKRVWKNL